MKKSKKIVLLITLFLLISSVAFSSSARIDENYLNGFYSFMSSMYYRDVNEDDLLGGSFNGILKESSIYACYETKELSEKSPLKSFGATFEKVRSGLLVSNVYPGSQAAIAGIQAGDLIYRINRISTSVMNTDDFDYALSLADGQAKIEVVKADSNEIVTIEAKLDNSYLSLVDFFISDEIGYIRINQFEERTSDEVAKALAWFDINSIETIIVDMRDLISMNIGEASEVVDFFIPYGRIASGEDQVFSATFKKEYHRVNLIINEKTKGAGEVIARAIKNHDTGTVYGEQSTGFDELLRTYPVFTDEGFLFYSNLANTTDINLIAKYLDSNSIEINSEYLAGYLHIDEGILVDDVGQSYENGVQADVFVKAERDINSLTLNSNGIWIRQDYKMGDLSYDIFIAEKIFTELGLFSEVPDVIFDAKTQEAVNLYKQSINYQEDGILDMATQNILNYDLYKLSIVEDECIINVIDLIREKQHE